MILVDTHVVLWLALEPSRISRKARVVIEENRQSGEGLAISDMIYSKSPSSKAKGVSN